MEIKPIHKLFILVSLKHFGYESNFFSYFFYIDWKHRT
jgi:hypothetical protein